MSTETQNSGLVFKKSTGNYFIRTAENEVSVCSISSRLRKVLVYPSRDPSSLPYFKVVDVDDIKLVDPVAVGDTVEYVDGGLNTGVITKILPRKSKLTRRAAGRKPLEQVIVANVDQIVTVMSAEHPRPQWNLLDRYLASAEASEVPALICITKMDLVKDKKLHKDIDCAADLYTSMGYTVLLTSSESGEGIDLLRDALRDKLSTVIGKSGVGKSSLLNALQPELGLRVNQINTGYDKGRHTTTHLEMFALDFGGHIVDTPGIKTFGLWDTDPEDVAMLFRDIAPYVGECKFGISCTHEREPGCAIKAAVKSGAINQRRYQSYLHLCKTLTAEY